VYNNEFINIGDSMLSPAPFVTPKGLANIRIYNNIFRIEEIDTVSAGFIRMYNSAGLIGYTNIHIINNLFIDNTNNNIGISVDVEVGNNPGTNNIIANNMFVNFGGAGTYSLMWKLFPSSGAGQSTWTITNNIMHAGAGHTPRVSYLGTVYTVDAWKTNFDPSVRTNLPNFVNYTPKSLNNNFHLLGNNTDVIGRGIAYSELFTSDKDGTDRGTTWDIGPYERQGGESQPTGRKLKLKLRAQNP